MTERRRHTTCSEHREASPAIDLALRAHGLRCTVARRLILSALRSMSDHPTVTQLHTTLVARGHRLGVATVYQNLARLAESSLVSRFLDSQGLLRFDANLSPHHHLLCRSCGRILDVGLSEQHAARLAELTHDLAGVHGSWQLEDGQLELHGVCPACRQQRTVSHCSKGSAANQGPP